jgi:hypothetical protein
MANTGNKIGTDNGQGRWNGNDEYFYSQSKCLYSMLYKLGVRDEFGLAFHIMSLLYSLTRQFFLSESVLVANPELGVSRTKGRLSRSESKNLSRL